MKALNRGGVMHYQEGTENVPLPQPRPQMPSEAPVSVPSDTQPPFTLHQLISGQLAAVQTNPQASPLAQATAGFLDHINRNVRAQNVAAAVKPSPIERMGTFIFGSNDAHQALQDRDAAAAHLSTPEMQQHLRENPSALMLAESDPVRFSQSIQQALKNREDAYGPIDHGVEGVAPKISSNPEALMNVANKNGVPVHYAHVAAEPNAYTDDEFVKSVAKMPRHVVHQLFGPQLAHVTSTQEQIAGGYLNMLQKDIVAKTAEYEKVKNDPKQKGQAVALLKQLTEAHNNFQNVFGTMARGYSPLPPFNLGQ